MNRQAIVIDLQEARDAADVTCGLSLGEYTALTYAKAIRCIKLFTHPRIRCARDGRYLTQQKSICHLDNCITTFIMSQNDDSILQLC